MVESIYWLNGNIDSSGRDDCEVGEGWFVSISNDGLAQLKEIVDVSYIHKKLSRSKGTGSDVREESVVKVLEIQ